MKAINFKFSCVNRRYPSLSAPYFLSDGGKDEVGNVITEKKLMIGELAKKKKLSGIILIGEGPHAIDDGDVYFKFIYID